MDRLYYPNHRFSRYLIVALSFAIYLAAFKFFHDRVGIGIASLAILPVIAAGWYFGIRGGILTAVLSVLSNVLIHRTDGYDLDVFLQDPGHVIGTFSLLILAIVFGRLSTVTHERRNALAKLEQIEKERELHTHFLEKLDRITTLALEPDDLQSTLEILTEHLAGLFHAEDAFFTFWDALREVPIPTAAYGSMKDIYPSFQFEPGETSLAASVIKAERPIAVADKDDSPHVSPKLGAIFSGRSMLGIPLITQKHKIGSILLGFKEKRLFSQEEILRAEITSEQMALVISKLQLLEEERKRLRQLSALHDVALTAIDADNEDELIERVTDIIGNNLFPDNFGIMLLDDEEDILRAHPSYHFRSVENIKMKDLRTGEGIAGAVARSGQPERIGNVRRVDYYVDVDARTMSELCVPIKFKERILGVINAESIKPNAFSLDDERLLVTLAGQLATAIEQLRKEQAERKWMDQLAHSNDLIYSIAHITTQIEKPLSAGEVIQTLGNELKKIDLTCIMAMYDDQRKSFTINYTSLEPQHLAIVEEGLGYPLVGYTFPRHKINSLVRTEDMLRPAFLERPAEEIQTLFTRINLAGVASILQRIGVNRETEPLRLPLVFEENLLGILWVWGIGLTRSDLPILSVFAKQIGTSLERVHLFQEVQSLALTDPLTGLQNRRSVFELGRIEFSRAQRMDRPFSCMMVDLDYFKKINDEYGHQTGDLVLQEFAKRCSHSLREVDLVGRYGGEEFIILLPETNRDTAVQVAERLRASFAEKPVKIEGMEICVTTSIGVAARDINTTHLEALIARADQALYIAKHKGRDQVAISV